MELNSFRQAQWQFPQVDREAVKRLAVELSISRELSTILWQRGIREEKEAQAFLYPTLNALPSPLLMKGMDKAVQIVHHACVNKIPVVLYGDYDVDGVTGVAILARFAEKIGLHCLRCHPDRFDDGYGLSADLVEKTCPQKGLVLTVDCGISDYDAVKQLKKGGWQVIITDHHQPPDLLPAADAILNPWQSDCAFPGKELAGVGVAFYLVMGLRTYFADHSFWEDGQVPNLKKMLDLVAVGTVSDLVPLLGINRIIAKAGFEVLANTENVGLSSILSLCGIKRGQQVYSDDVSFQLGPRLNAAGRMGRAGRASELLATTDQGRAYDLACEIDRENLNRRKLTSLIINEATTLAEAERDEACIILHRQEWHLGLIGIVSSKLVDLFHKPVVIFSGKNKLKGSARSIPGVDMHGLFSQCEDLVIEYGGHSAAAGLSIEPEMLPDFRKRLCRLTGEATREIDTSPTIEITLKVDEKRSIADLLEVHRMLQPFGQGNPEPIYSTRAPCRLRNIQVIGKDKNHLRFSVCFAGEWHKCIGFGFGAAVDEVGFEKELSAQLAFTIKNNRFKGNCQLQLQLEDIVFC